MNTYNVSEMAQGQMMHSHSYVRYPAVLNSYTDNTNQQESLAWSSSIIFMIDKSIRKSCLIN